MSALGAAEQLCLGCMRPKGDGEICPRCGYRLDPNRNPLALPYREVVGQKFLIGRILGKPGGFGTTYLAWDLVLQTALAVKEYLPRDLASRAADRSSAILQSAGDRELYEYGLNQFLQEARTLAQISHPKVAALVLAIGGIGWIAAHRGQERAPLAA
jgi:serine/threonine protein kinase